MKASKLGFNISLLEHLCEKDLYKPDDLNDGKYNSQYITMLLKNYRSHEVILGISNALFYDYLLEPCASPGS